MKNIFKLETVLVGRQFKMSNYPEVPLGAWNPAAYVKDGELVILPRLHFDTRFYASSIGLCEPLKFSELSEYNYGARPIKTQLIKYPANHYEMNGVEDPRITENTKKILTVGIFRGASGLMNSQTAMHDFNQKEITSSKPLLFNDSEIQTGRDAVLINGSTLFFRPELKPLRTYRAFYTINEKNVEISTDGLRILPELDAQNGEDKRGMSTNVVKLGENLYIAAWHVVYEDKLEYKEGFMLLNDDGGILGMSDLLIETSGIQGYGHRPFTVFGCGLVLVKDMLYFIGGIGDVWTGIYSAELDKVVEEIKEK